MGDSSVKKVQSKTSPKGALGQKYLASGIHVSMRLWEDEQPGEPKIEVGQIAADPVARKGRFQQAHADRRAVDHMEWRHHQQDGHAHSPRPQARERRRGWSVRPP